MKNWTVKDYAQHYVETINSAPNAWGQHVSKLFGQSHNIMAASVKLFGDEATQKAIKELLSKNT